MKGLKALIEKRTSLQKDMRAMSDTITKETRAMTDEESAKWDALKTDVANITRTITELQEARELEESQEQEDGGDGGSADETTEQTEAREARAFSNHIRAIVTKEDRADANLTFGANGSVIPKTIANKIVAKVYDISPVVEKATKYVTKGTLEIPVYGANSGTDITVAYQTEFAELESKIGKFTSVELGGFLAGALVKLSNSLINNTDLDLVNFTVERIAYEVARFMEHELLIGTDSKIQGIRTLDSAQVVTTSDVGVISADDLIALKNRVKQAFRSGAIWVMSNDTKTAIETLKDDNGRYLFTDDNTSEFDGKIKGYPVYVSDNMPNVGTGVKAIFFGDFTGLALKWTEQLEIQVLKEKYATQHATGVVAWLEADSAVENHQKLSVLTVKAS